MYLNHVTVRRRPRTGLGKKKIKLTGVGYFPPSMVGRRLLVIEASYLKELREKIKLLRRYLKACNKASAVGLKHIL